MSARSSIRMTEGNRHPENFRVPDHAYLPSDLPFIDAGNEEHVGYMTYLDGRVVLCCQMASVEEGWVEVLIHDPERTDPAKGKWELLHRNTRSGHVSTRFYGVVQILKMTPERLQAAEEAKLRGEAVWT